MPGDLDGNILLAHRLAPAVIEFRLHWHPPATAALHRDGDLGEVGATWDGRPAPELLVQMRRRDGAADLAAVPS